MQISRIRYFARPYVLLKRPHNLYQGPAFFPHSTNRATCPLSPNTSPNGMPPGPRPPNLTGSRDNLAVHVTSGPTMDSGLVICPLCHQIEQLESDFPHVKMVARRKYWCHFTYGNLRQLFSRTKVDIDTITKAQIDTRKAQPLCACNIFRVELDAGTVCEMKRGVKFHFALIGHVAMSPCVALVSSSFT